MTATTFRQKISLIGLGVLVSFLLLEIGLRIAGGIVLFLQERHNHLSSDQNAYRILCLGESTTALGGEDSYPSQLEKILNSRNSKKKFIVINKGLVSTTTDYILAHADQNLDLYKPQLVIVMMGINDEAYPRPSKMPLWLWQTKLFIQDLKVYKLTNLLYKHITHRVAELKSTSKLELLKEDNDYESKEKFIKNLILQETLTLGHHVAMIQNYEKANQIAEAKLEYDMVQKTIVIIRSASIDLSRRYLQQGRLSDAQTYLEQATLFDDNTMDLYELWGEFYLAQGKAENAMLAFNRALLIDPKNNAVLLGLARAAHLIHKPEALLIYMNYLNKNSKDYWGYIELARWFKEEKKYSQAIDYLNKAIQIESTIEKAYLDLAEILEEQQQYAQEEEFFLKLIKNDSKKTHLIQALGKFYQRRGNGDLATKYLKQASQLGLKEYTPWTWSNYEMLLKKISNQGSKVIIMQYPMRSIDALKEYLGHKKDLVFVENKMNFKEALRTGKFGDYFSDSFANDFGHCTRKGNQLIAENLVPAVIKIAQGE